MFQGLRFPFKITPQCPKELPLQRQISLWESKYFLLLLSSYILSDGKVSVFQFPLKLYHSGFQKKVFFLKRSFQLEVLSPRTYKYDSVENDMERKSSKICITFNCYQIWHIRSGLYEPFTWLVLGLDRG